MGERVDPGSEQMLEIRQRVSVGHDAEVTHERGVFDGRGLVTGNQSRALEYGGASCRCWRLAGWRSGTRWEEKNEA